MTVQLSTHEKLEQVCKAFRIQGSLQSYEEIKVGNVNKTYRVNFLQEDGKRKSYIVQAVNTYVFKNPVQVMSNIDLVTEHIHAKAPKKRVLHFHHTADRKTYLMDDKGFWRLFNYIPSNTYNTTDNLDIIRNAGEAFGQFQMMLSDFDASSLYETIPNFHNTPKRYEQLIADAQADPKGRLAEARPEYDWLLSVREQACRLTNLHEQGLLPLRVTHNDTKLNNVLFDKASGNAICVIDLDTVMPGFAAHDFGDAIRFGASTAAEDEKDLNKVSCDMTLFEAYFNGFMEGCRGSLTDKEVEALPMGAKIMTFECGMRFLTDYLQGDTYFKIHYPEQNLDRTRTQLKLVKDMEEKWDIMARIVRN